MLHKIPLFFSALFLVANNVGAMSLPALFPNVSSPTDVGTPTTQTPFALNGSLGGILFCQDVNWVNCTFTVQPLNTCISMTEAWNNSISSLGPDFATVVIAYDGDHCDGKETAFVFPGNRNLIPLGWNDIISSIKALAI